MKIKCEHCGSLIDINKHSTCPNCKATFTDSKEYKEYKAKEKEKEEYNAKIKKDTIEGAKKAAKFAWIPFFLPPIIFIIAFIVIGVIACSAIKKTNNDFVDDTTEEFINEIIEQQEIDEFDIVVDSVVLKKSLDKYFLSSDDLRKGYVYALVHIYYENKTDSTEVLSYNDFDLVIDGISQKNKTYLYDDRISSTVNAGSKIEGYLVYEVPSGSNDFTIKYNGKEFKVQTKSSN